MEKSIKEKTILITGGFGFIGSAYLWFLNEQGCKNIILCDRFREEHKWKNIRSLEFLEIVLVEDLWKYLEKNTIDIILHLGACSTTTEENMDFLFRNNYEFSKQLWQVAINQKADFFYASSAATYGNGYQLNDFSTNQNLRELQPLNKYGYSKQLFDLWVEKQTKSNHTPPRYAGVKFFNVFGPNEYHKGSMASVVYHAYQQIKKNGEVKLFKSHNPDYKDGEQQRDFIYIKDVCSAIHLLITEFDKIKKTKKYNFLYNLGSGKASTFKELVKPIFTALNLETKIVYIDTPEKLRKNYQYFTQAQLEWSPVKSWNFSLDNSVKDYVINHLEKENPFLKINDKYNMDYLKKC